MKPVHMHPKRDASLKSSRSKEEYHTLRESIRLIRPMRIEPMVAGSDAQSSGKEQNEGAGHEPYAWCSKVKIEGKYVTVD